jgi:glycosyltransferase involved in cell wall biosynthesis
VSAVLFAAEYYPPFAPGGAEWSNAAWAAALARRGRRVVVVTPNYGAPAREEHDGVLVVRVPFPVKLPPGPREARWLVHRNPLFHAYLAAWIARVARRERAAVIHAQGKGALVAAWLAGALARRPVVATVRDVGLLCPLGSCTMFEPWTVFDCSLRQFRTRCAPYFLEHYHPGQTRAQRARTWLSLGLGWLDERLRHAALRRVRRVVGVSRGILDLYPARLVDPRRRSVVHTLPPAVADAAGPEEAGRVRRRLGIAGGPLVLYAGKLSPGKGAPVFAEAVEVVRAAVPGARFALAGKGSLGAPAPPDVALLGPVPQADLFALYRAAEVVVVPSVWPEPLSRVLLEAMALGRPVVATAVGGTPEAVEHGVTGLLVPRGDAQALGKAIAELLLDPARRERMGRAAALRAAREFTEERAVASLLEVYERAAAERA